MTLQELFNLAWTAFVVEKKPPSMNKSGCAYRGANGGKCIAGLAIPDAEYVPEMDVTGLVPALLHKFPALRRYFPIDIDAVHEMQRCHDDATADPKKFHAAIESNLRAYAKKYSLEIPKEPVHV